MVLPACAVDLYLTPHIAHLTSHTVLVPKHAAQHAGSLQLQRCRKGCRTSVPMRHMIACHNAETECDSTMPTLGKPGCLGMLLDQAGGADSGRKHVRQVGMGCSPGQSSGMRLAARQLWLPLAGPAWGRAWPHSAVLCKAKREGMTDMSWLLGQCASYLRAANQKVDARERAQL